MNIFAKRDIGIAILITCSLVKIFAKSDMGIAILIACSLVKIFAKRDRGIAVLEMGTTTFGLSSCGH